MMTHKLILLWNLRVSRHKHFLQVSGRWFSPHSRSNSLRRSSVGTIIPPEWCPIWRNIDDWRLMSKLKVKSTFFSGLTDSSTCWFTYIMDPSVSVYSERKLPSVRWIYSIFVSTFCPSEIKIRLCNPESISVRCWMVSFRSLMLTFLSTLQTLVA